MSAENCLLFQSEKYTAGSSRVSHHRYRSENILGDLGLWKWHVNDVVLIFRVRTETSG